MVPFFRPARAAAGVTPERVTTDGHGSYPWAIRTVLGRRAAHRTSACKNNRLEQDHRGVKGRTRCTRGSKGSVAAERFRRGHDELRAFLRTCTRHNQTVPADRRRLPHLRRAAAALAVLVAVWAEFRLRLTSSDLARALTEPVVGGPVPDRMACPRPAS